ncbi:DUF262 domain-containing protein [Micromonospora sp. ATA51]|uniref:DUF262 domain-containing protein n=1 Tax=Micromonospora sp. ATA51 TaxID=2806098 RepID=UPI001A60726F|nr:DUF262 domain-containing protein [Micromonospora sp. ATA51]MBM0224815.1 DUF262 domain-containing protein [Micromonospora sp. ATA51]
MRADTVQLVHVFGTDRRHVVPVFQRPYVWEQERNWEPLWSDVRMAAEEVEAEINGAKAAFGQSPRTHFLGAIVLERLPPAPGRILAMNVIDGQQRLTTLQVMLASCWAATKEHAADNAEALLRLFLHNTPQLVHPSHPYERYKVWPSLPDRDTFKKVFAVELPPERANEHRLLAARRYFDGEVSAWLAESPKPAERADALVIALRERLGLVEIQLESQDDAQVIFETLNDRGTRLRASDLVKNTLFRMAEQQGQDVIALHEEHWVPFESAWWGEEVTTGRFKRARIDLLLSYWLSIQTGLEVPVERLFADFRRWHASTHASAAEVLADLAHHGRAMRRLENLPGVDPTGRLLQVLDMLKTTTPVPILLHLQAREEVSAEQRARAADAIESLIVRRFVCGLTTKDYNRLFLSVLQNIRKAQDAVVGELLRDQLAANMAESRRWPDDGDFVGGLLQNNLYRTLRGPRLRVLLAGLETYLRGDKAELTFSPAQAANLSVEHLLPQEWAQHYPLPNDLPEDEAKSRRSAALHKLGNLTLTTTKLNSSISNGPWHGKRAELNKHAVLLLTAASVLQPHEAMPAEAARTWSEGWTENHIDLRTFLLAHFALKAWPRPE